MILKILVLMVLVSSVLGIQTTMAHSFVALKDIVKLFG